VVRRGTRVDVFDPTAGTRQQDRPATPPGGYPAVPADDTHLALSADGAELAAVTPSGDGLSRWRGSTRYEVPGLGVDVGAPAYDRRGFLWVGAVGQRPAQVAAPLHLGVPFTAARGLAWLDEQQIATIAATRGSGARPLVLSVDGSVSTLTAAPGARTVAATGGERGLYVLTDKGRLLSRSGVRWVDSGPADDLATAAG